jgi:hypothetical protein
MPFHANPLFGNCSDRFETGLVQIEGRDVLTRANVDLRDSSRHRGGGESDAPCMNDIGV